MSTVGNKQFKDFREELEREARRTPAPSLQTILSSKGSQTHRMGFGGLSWGSGLRWVIAAMVVMALGAVPVYKAYQARIAELDREAQLERQIDDLVLMYQVDQALSQDVPQAMNVLWEGDQQ